MQQEVKEAIFFAYIVSNVDSNSKPFYYFKQIENGRNYHITKNCISYSYYCFKLSSMIKWEWDCLLNVTYSDISVIYMTAHGCAGGLKKKLNLRSGSQRHSHFVGTYVVSSPSKHRHGANLFTVIRRIGAKTRHISVVFYDAHGDTEDLFSS